MRVRLVCALLLAACGAEPAEDAGAPAPDAGSPPPVVDADGDTILDADEGWGDFDLDGIPNAEDLDSDNDFVPDAEEAGDALLETPPLTSNGGPRPDFQNIDVDEDLILDGDEWGVDTDGDGLFDQLDLDTDADGIPDVDEAGDADVHSPPVDSDEDGIADFRDVDSDNDGLTDAEELAYGSDPTRPDSDDDGASDLLEVQRGGHPTEGVTDPGAPLVSVWFDMPYEMPPSPTQDVLRFELDPTTLPTARDLTPAYVPSEEYDYFGSLEAAPGADGCTATLGVADRDGDGTPETLLDVAPGDVACWTIRPRVNDDLFNGSYEVLLGHGRLYVATGTVDGVVGHVLYRLHGCHGPCGPD